MHASDITCRLLMGALTLFASAGGSSINWSREVDLPLPCGGYVAVLYRKGLMIAGGTYWNDGKKLWTDRVQFFDPAAKRWSEWAPLPRPLAYGCMIDASGKVFLLGGADDKALYRDVYRLQGNEWVRVGETPSALVYSAAVFLNGRIYLLGGGSSTNDLSTATREAWTLNTKNGKWQQLEPMPGPPRVLHAAAAHGDSIYVFGGSTQEKGKDLVNLDDVYRLEQASGKWKAMRRAPLAVRAWWAASAGPSIYLFGGYSDRFLDSVYRYDPGADEYSLVSSLPVPICDAKFFYAKGFFYGAGGEDKGGSRFPGTLIGRLQ